MLKQRTVQKKKDAEAESEAALARRDARRNRAGVYQRNDGKAAGGGPGKMKKSRGAATRKVRRAVAVVPDVDLDADKPAPVIGNLIEKEIKRQQVFRNEDAEGSGLASDDAGWYTIKVPETREDMAAEQIMTISGTDATDGMKLDIWVPRRPSKEYVVAESEAAGKAKLQLMQAVPDEMGEKLFSGYILLYLPGMSKRLLESLDGLYAFMGFHTMGVSSFGTKRRENSEKNRPMTEKQLERLYRICDVRVVPDAEAAAAKAAAKRAAEAAERAAAMGELEEATMSDEDVAAMRMAAGAPAEGGKRKSDAIDGPKVPEGATSLQVHEGPFKVRNRFTSALSLVIFVPLDAPHFACG